MEENSSVASTPHDELIVVLKISEAIGLNVVGTEMVWLQASISGNKLDRGPIKTGHTTTFDCSLIWETDRRSIKQMKVENLPVKIDIYGIKNFKGNVHDATREFIGYVLLPVRGIQMLPSQKAIKTKCRWTKLIGLSREWKPHKPEVLVNVFITDKDYLKIDYSSQPAKSEEIHESIIIEENPNPSMMTSQKGIFVRLIQSEGLLQVGNMDTSCEIFNVKILIDNVKFLDNIIPESSDNISDREFFMSYIVLGNNHSKKLDRKFNRTHQIQEKISINFRSCLAMLKDYFEHIFYIPIEIYLNDKLVGQVEIRIDNVIDIVDMQEFLVKFPNGQQFHGGVELKTANVIAPNKPLIEYKVLIIHQGTKKLRPRVVIDEGAGGDYVRESDLPDTCDDEEQAAGFQRNPLRVENGQNATYDVITSKPSFNPSEKADIESILNEQEGGKISEIPRLFSYNLILKSIKFNKKPHKGNWQISMYHEMADTPRTFINRLLKDEDIEGNVVKFDDLELKLYFTSYSQNIMELFKSSQKCMLCIKGPYNTHAKAYLDCRNLIISSKEKTSGNIMLKDLNEGITALAEIFVFLDDAGLNFNAQKESEFENDDCPKLSIEAQKESMFDEELAHGMLTELEEWKEYHQKKFLKELKVTECEFLEKLKTEFLEMKETYEQSYQEKDKEMENLAKSLQDAQNSLKQKTIEESINSECMNRMKLEMEQNYADNLLAIKERTKQLEEDFSNELSLKNYKIEELQAKNAHLYEKVQFLTHENCDLKKNIETLKSSLIPKVELENLVRELSIIQEKYDNAITSKNFYKQQWAKSFRECHKIRRENTHERKDSLFASKCDKLYDMLSDDDCEVSFDKEELEEIKYCLELDDELQDEY